MAGTPNADLQALLDVFRPRQDVEGAPTNALHGVALVTSGDRRRPTWTVGFPR